MSLSVDNPSNSSLNGSYYCFTIDELTHLEMNKNYLHVGCGYVLMTLTIAFIMVALRLYEALSKSITRKLKYKKSHFVLSLQYLKDLLEWRQKYLAHLEAVEPVMENTDPPTLQGNQGTLFET